MLSLRVADLASLLGRLRPLDVAVVDVRATIDCLTISPVSGGVIRRPRSCSSRRRWIRADPRRDAGRHQRVPHRAVSAAALEAASSGSTAQKIPDVAGQLFAFIGAKGGVGTTTWP